MNINKRRPILKIKHNEEREYGTVLLANIWVFTHLEKELGRVKSIYEEDTDDT